MKEVIMPTNLAIDDKLIQDALIIGKHRTKKAVVTEALQEYIQRRKQVELIELFGTIDYDSNHEYKQQRQIK
jgi:Arc/MetJ family transcription regulator